MAANSGFFRIGSIKNAQGGLLPALRHNKRDLPEKSDINPDRTPLNYCLHHIGNENMPQAINRAVNVILAQNDIKPRKNACIAIECIFSLHDSRMSKETRPFFEACFEWLKKALAGKLEETAIAGVLISFDVHLDEKAPHAHALILPLLDGRLKGAEIKGGKGRFNKRNNSFMREVGVPHGLKPTKSLTSNEKTQMYTDVIQTFEANKDPVMLATYWPAFRDSIKLNPLPYAEALGVVRASLRVKTGKPKTLAEIMTKPCNPESKRKTAA
jgi:hypothetical protein